MARAADVEAHSASDPEVAIVGAGQAGLAMGYFLRQKGIPFVILERADSIGSAWRERWDSLTLFFTAAVQQLAGALPGDPEGYPMRDEVIDYLERYAETFDLPVELNSEVHELRADDERFALHVDGRTRAADQVVVATGPFQTPYIPRLTENLSREVFQAHAVAYRRPSDLPQGRVLVVGGGNTGFQIAKEPLRHPQGRALGRFPAEAASQRLQAVTSFVADEDKPSLDDRGVAASAAGSAIGRR